MRISDNEHFQVWAGNLFYGLLFGLFLLPAYWSRSDLGLMLTLGMVIWITVSSIQSFIIVWRSSED